MRVCFFLLLVSSSGGWLGDVEGLKAVHMEQVKHHFQGSGLDRLVIHLAHLEERKGREGEGRREREGGREGGGRGGREGGREN